MKSDIMFQIRVRKIAKKILLDKGKSKAVAMAEFNNRKNKSDKKEGVQQ